MKIKHYADFGAKMNSKIGEELSKSAWELLRIGGKDKYFSFTEKDKDEYKKMCYERKDYRNAARKILEILKCHNIQAGVVSVGCGKGILEWNLKNLKPELHISCTDYTEKSLECLRGFFPECDDIYTMDMRSAKAYRKIAKKKQIVLFYRVSTEADFATWKSIFYKMFTEGVKYIIFVPAEFCTFHMVVDNYKNAIINLVRKKKESKKIFCGYIYSKRTSERMWKKYYMIKDARPIGDTMIFLLERKVV